MEVKNFQEEVLESKIPVLVDFFAEWCGPCKMVAPVLEELAAEYSDKMKVLKVNIDTQSELAQLFRVVSVPTMILFENGEIKDSFIGFRSKEELVELLGL